MHILLQTACVGDKSCSWQPDLPPSMFHTLTYTTISFNDYVKFYKCTEMCTTKKRTKHEQLVNYNPTLLLLVPFLLEALEKNTKRHNSYSSHNVITMFNPLKPRGNYIYHLL
jgi:hypothetical protein